MPEFNVTEIANKATGAHRANYRPLFDEQMLGLSERELTDEERQRDEDLRTLATLGSVKEHPGYQMMRAARLKTIAHFRSGEYAKAAAVDAEVDDAKFGQLMRLGMLVADELEKELNTVEAAADAVEQEKARGRKARPKQSGAR
jgi:hypothetical protein